jgi:hypothetical protein
MVIRIFSGAEKACMTQRKRSAPLANAIAVPQPYESQRWDVRIYHSTFDSVSQPSL